MYGRHTLFKQTAAHTEVDIDDDDIAGANAAHRAQRHPQRVYCDVLDVVDTTYVVPPPIVNEPADVNLKLRLVCGITKFYPADPLQATPCVWWCKMPEKMARHKSSHHGIPLPKDLHSLYSVGTTTSVAPHVASNTTSADPRHTTSSDSTMADPTHVSTTAITQRTTRRQRARPVPSRSSFPGTSHGGEVREI